MESPEKQSSYEAKLPAFIVALIAALLAGVSLNRSAIPDSNRPASKKADAMMQESYVPRRLWEDPLVLAPSSLTTQSVTPGDCEDTFSNTRQGTNGDQSKLYLPMVVFADGGQYAEDREQRIRARAAILASLLRWGFEPENAEALWLCQLKGDPKRLVSYETFARTQIPKYSTQQQNDQANFRNQDILQTRVNRVTVVWVNDSVLRYPVRNENKEPPSLRDVYSGILTQLLLKPKDSETGKSAPQSKKVQTHPANKIKPEKSVAQKTPPINEIGNISHDARRGDSPAQPIKELAPVPVVIGPLNRDMAALLDRTLFNSPQADVESNNANNSSKPSDGKSAEPQNDIPKHRIFRPFRASLQQETGDDSQAMKYPRFEFGKKDEELAEIIISELKLRGLRLSQIQRSLPTHENRKESELHWHSCMFDDHIALINESDTSHNRAFRLAFVNKIERDAVGTNPVLNGKDIANVHGFAFTRGLDGKALEPETREAAGVAANSAAIESARSGTERTAASTYEQSSGTSQRDYVRRIADQIAERDTALKHFCGRETIGIKGIGILGSDFHDKLMLLKTLKQRFPESIFFTTDLDARLLDPPNTPVTRNLLVASNYDLSLAPAIQRFIAPFRDSNQTGLFLTTSYALLKARQEPTVPMFSQVDRWNELEPRVYEIGLTQAHALGSFSDPEKCALQATTELSSNLFECGDIHPVRRRTDARAAFLASIKVSGVGLFAYLLAVMVWAPREKWLLPKIAAAVLLTLIVPFGVYAMLAHQADFDKQEIFAWIDGVSVWPSLWIRWLALLVGAYLLARGTRMIAHGLQRTSLHYRLISSGAAVPTHPPPAKLRRESGKLAALILLTGKTFKRRLISGFCGAPPPGNQTRAKAGDEAKSREPSTASTSWGWFVEGVNPYLQLTAGIPWATLVLALLVYIFTSKSELLPIRGDNGLTILWIVGVACTFVLLILIFLALSVALRIKTLALNLSNSHSRWPESTIKVAKRDLSAKLEYRVDIEAAQKQSEGTGSSGYDIFHQTVDHYTDIHILADVSDGGRWLLYYPAIVLALMIAARWTRFDAWPVDSLVISVYLIFGICALSSVLVVANAAKRVRERALEHLEQLLRSIAEDIKMKALANLVRFVMDDIRRERKGIFLANLGHFVTTMLIPMASAGGLELLNRFLASGN